VLDPEHPVLLVAALTTGFVVNPLWWIWLGVALRGTDRDTDREAGVTHGWLGLGPGPHVAFAA
jgi:hypothetical protein